MSSRPPSPATHSLLSSLLWPHWRQLWSHSLLDDHIHGLHAHLVHNARWLQLCHQRRLLQMRKENRLFSHSHLNLLASFSFCAMVSVISLLSFLCFVCARSMTGESGNQPSSLQLLRHIAPRLNGWNGDQRLRIPVSRSRAFAHSASLL